MYGDHAISHYDTSTNLYGSISMSQQESKKKQRTYVTALEIADHMRSKYGIEVYECDRKKCIMLSSGAYANELMTLDDTRLYYLFSEVCRELKAVNSTKQFQMVQGYIGAFPVNTTDMQAFRTRYGVIENRLYVNNSRGTVLACDKYGICQMQASAIAKQAVFDVETWDYKLPYVVDHGQYPNGYAAQTRERMSKVFAHIDEIYHPFIYGWMCMAPLRKYIEMPVLALIGERACGKTTAATMMKGIVDPSNIDAVVLPDDIYTLALFTREEDVCVIDNMHKMKASVASALCAAITSGAFISRKLYSQKHTARAKVETALIITSTAMPTTDGDFISRCAVVRFARTKNPEAKSLMLVSAEHEAPYLRRAILDSACKILSGHSDIMQSSIAAEILKVTSGHRMGHFMQLAAYCASTTGGYSTEEVLQSFDVVMQETMQEYAADEDEAAIYAPLLEILHDKQDGWRVSVSDLLDMLNATVQEDIAACDEFPKYARNVRAYVTAAKDHLRSAGWHALPRTWYGYKVFVFNRISHDEAGDAAGATLSADQAASVRP